MAREGRVLVDPVRAPLPEISLSFFGSRDVAADHLVGLPHGSIREEAAAPEEWPGLGSARAIQGGVRGVPVPDLNEPGSSRKRWLLFDSSVPMPRNESLAVKACTTRTMIRCLR